MAVGNGWLNDWRQRVLGYRIPDQSTLRGSIQEMYGLQGSQEPSEEQYANAILEQMLANTGAAEGLSPFALSRMRNSMDEDSLLMAALAAGARGYTMTGDPSNGPYNTGIPTAAAINNWLSNYYGNSGQAPNTAQQLSDLMQNLETGSNPNTSEFYNKEGINQLSRMLTRGVGGSYGQYMARKMREAQQGYIGASASDSTLKWTDYLKQRGLWNYPVPPSNFQMPGTEGRSQPPGVRPPPVIEPSNSSRYAKTIQPPVVGPGPGTGRVPGPDPTVQPYYKYY